MRENKGTVGREETEFKRVAGVIVNVNNILDLISKA